MPKVSRASAFQLILTYGHATSHALTCKHACRREEDTFYCFYPDRLWQVDSGLYGCSAAAMLHSVAAVHAC